VGEGIINTKTKELWDRVKKLWFRTWIQLSTKYNYYNSAVLIAHFLRVTVTIGLFIG